MSQTIYTTQSNKLRLCGVDQPEDMRNQWATLAAETKLVSTDCDILGKVTASLMLTNFQH